MLRRSVMFLSLFLICTAQVSWSSFPAVARAAELLPAADGKVILTVRGAITRTNRDGAAEFSRSDLERLGRRSIRTATIWHSGVQEFEGVPLKALLDRVGATGRSLLFTALDRYTSTITLEEVERYDPILAMRRNGAVMPIRDKGPLELVFPFDDHPELRTRAMFGRAIWQIRTLDVE